MAAEIGLYEAMSTLRAVRRLRPELPVPLEAIVNRCLSKDPADRYQSTREILAEIRGCLTNAQSNSETSP